MADLVETMVACPWCATTNHLSIAAVGPLTNDMSARPYRVVCDHIDHDQVAGPVAYGRHAATIAWNTRLTPPAIQHLVTDVAEPGKTYWRSEGKPLPPGDGGRPAGGLRLPLGEVGKLPLSPCFYVIPMPIDANGVGPADEDQTVTTVYEVWDELFLSHVSTPTQEQAQLICTAMNVAAGAQEAANMAKTRLMTFAKEVEAGRVQGGGREFERRIWGAFAEMDALFPRDVAQKRSEIAPEMLRTPPPTKLEIMEVSLDFIASWCWHKDHSKVTLQERFDAIKFHPLVKSWAEKREVNL